MSISSNTNNNKINLTVPKLINFIHKCYINIAREIWKNPLLFSEDISGYEYQKNINTIEHIICDCIENTIRISLPVKEILKEHLDIYDNKSTESKNLGNESKLLNELKELLMKQNTDKVTEGNGESDEESGENNDVNINVDEEDSKEDKLDEFDSKEEDKSDTESKHRVDKNSNEESEEHINLQGNVYENNDGYVSPDEDAISEKCENLEINDIPDIKVDEKSLEDRTEGDTKIKAVEEQVYDNADIIHDSAKENNELYKKLIKISDETLEESLGNLESTENLETDKIVKIDKNQDKISTKDVSNDNKEITNISESPVISQEVKNEKPILSVDEKLKLEEESRKYDKIVDITEKESPYKPNKSDTTKEEIIIQDSSNDTADKKYNKKELSYIEDAIDSNKGDISEKEIMTVDKRDDDDKETVDLFYDDLKNLSEKKGLTMESVDETKYTLFDDLS